MINWSVLTFFYVCFKTGIRSLDSVNLQHNTLVRWADGTKDSLTKRLMFQLLFFFHEILQSSLQKPFQFIFYFFLYKITKMKIKSFECPKSIRNYKEKYLEHQTLGRRVVCPIGPAYYMYCRLSVLWTSPNK